jgi:hypothetical protein
MTWIILPSFIETTTKKPSTPVEGEIGLIDQKGDAETHRLILDKKLKKNQGQSKRRQEPQK